MPAAVDRQFAQTLARGLDILRCFTVNDIALSNGDISGRTGLPKATVSRLTYTLTTLGYLRFVPELGKYGRYALGSALISISHPLLANLGLRQLARASMHAMAEAERACLAIWMREGVEMVCIEVAQIAGRGSFGPDIGSVSPLSHSLVGAAYAARRAQSQTAIGDDLGASADQSHPSERNGLMEREKDRHERLGYCTDPGLFDAELKTVAAALRHPRSDDVFVFTCAMLGSDRRASSLRALGNSLLRIVKATELALAL